jgi:hypothetical protein
VTEQHHEHQPAPSDDVDQTDHAADAADARDPRIAAAVARLDTLGDRPPVEHVEVYEDVHRVLQESLADATHSPDGTDSTDGLPGGAQL